MRRYLCAVAGTSAILAAIVAPGLGADPVDCGWLLFAGAVALVAA